ncbi:MAG: hypothetical protein HKUEN01_01450 [Candidatus Kuenenia stuttgartiensis]|nr:MAG: hypothetical protein HKUEN01_01450 [Candidatus Kuenenia stuttgartiensis]
MYRNSAGNDDAYNNRENNNGSKDCGSRESNGAPDNRVLDRKAYHIFEHYHTQPEIEQ